MIKIKQPHGGVMRIYEKGDKRPDSHRKIVTKMKFLESYTPSEYQDTIGRMFTFQKTELEHVFKSRASTVFERLVASIIVKGNTEGCIRILERLLQLAISDPGVTKIEHTVTNKNVVPSIVTDDPMELSKYYKDIMG